MLDSNFNRYEEGDTIRPDRLLSPDEQWEEVDSMTYGTKFDGHYVTVEVSELLVTDVRSEQEVANECH